MAQMFGAIVVAAGAGTRLQADRPKALLPLQEKPLVRRAVQSMTEAGADPVVVVIPPDHRDDFRTALAGCRVTELVEGGHERTHSVRNGLNAIQSEPAVARPEHLLIHDAARPLVPPSVTERVVGALRAGAVAVVPVISVTDTIRQVTEAGSLPVDRRLLRSVQTPQGFNLGVVTQAYQRIGDEVITDDAGVCERAGHPVTLVDGSAASLKITHRTDLATAAALVEGASPGSPSDASAKDNQTPADSVPKGAR